MSSLFKVPLTTITQILPHNNADLLELAIIYNFVIIVKKGEFKVGDEVIYCPIDSLLPEKLEQYLFPVDSKIKLSGGRIRQCRIRKLASQGMIINPKDEFILQMCREFTGKKNFSFKVEEDYSKELGITHFTPPEPSYNISSGLKRGRKACHPQFHAYGGVTALKWFPNEFKETDEVSVTCKIHGCVRADEIVNLANGTGKEIKDIVDNRLDVEVLGYDEKTKKVIPTKIINWYDNGGTQSWVKVRFSKIKAGKGNHYGAVEVTPNHRFYMPELGIYRKAEELKKGDKLLYNRFDYQLNYIQEQVLIGSMLGDGYLGKDAMHFSHKKAHEDYLIYTLKALGNLAGNFQKEIISGYGTLMCRARTISNVAISDLFEDWVVNDKKIFPESFIDKIHPIAMAFLYMDDGSLAHHESQEDRANFAICDYDDSSALNLQKAFLKFGIKCTIYKGAAPSGKIINRIRINADDAEKFFLLVAQYIPPCMRYKLPERYRDLPNVDLSSIVEKYKNKLIYQEVLDVGTVTNKHKNLNRYDIETETHNFFVNGILVHNSNIRAAVLPTQVDTIWKKIKNVFGMLPKHSFIYGSNNVMITGNTNYTGYYGSDIYGKALEKYNIKNILKPGEQLFGELYGSSIQKNYTYGCNDGEQKLIFFDVKIHNADGTSRYLDVDEFQSWCRERNLPHVPELYRGKWNYELAKSLTLGPSILAPAQKVREGVVVKSVKEEVGACGRKCLKLISEVYLDDKNNSDFQ